MRSSTENGGNKREFKGKKGDLDVTIRAGAERAPRPPRLEVYARKNLAEWDKEYAQQLLARIVKEEPDDAPRSGESSRPRSM